MVKVPKRQKYSFKTVLIPKICASIIMKRRMALERGLFGGGLFWFLIKSVTPTKKDKLSIGLAD